MGTTHKSLALTLILLMALSSLILITAVKPANAQTIPKPSVPEFTLRYVDHSYDVSPTTTTTTDPYTGKITTKTTREGYHVDNRTIDFTIKNQPYIKNANTTGYWASGLFYNFRFKGHYENETNWKTCPAPSGNFDTYFQASNGTETVISLRLYQLAADYQIHGFAKTGDEIDFQVQALVGHEKSLSTAIAFQGERSDWSPTQTITVGETAVTSPNPSIPEISWLAIAPLMVSLFSVAVLLRHRKTALSRNVDKS